MIAPVVEGVVEREDGGFLPAVCGCGRGEGRRELVDEFAFGPEGTGRVEELLELGGG
jgi:hypothetical protein